MRVYTGSVWVDAYAAGTSFLAKANNLSDLPNVATARQNLDLEIGVDVQAYDATILKSADIGVTVQGYDADTAKYDDTTANFTGTLQNGGSNVLVDTDIGSTVQAYDATIVVDADIGVTVQGYDADTAKYDDTTANFTGTLQQGGNNVLTTASDYLDSADIGVTVQGYDANTLKSGDIGVTVQGYDADTVKYDDVNPSFTDTGAIKIPVGNEAQRPGTPAAGQLRFNDDTDEFEGYDGTAWGAIGGGGGDVVGPVSSTDNAIARFDLTTGKIIQDSGITIDDSNVFSGATQIYVDNLRLDGNTISSTDTNGDIVLAPNGSGDVQVDADTLRVGDSGVDATIQSNGNADLILKTGNATTGSVTLADGADGNLTVALNGTGQVIVNAGAVGTPTIAPTGDTNTGIYFPAADTIAFAEGGAEAMRIDSSANLQFNSGYGSVATAYGCRAWVNFNGTGTVAIRASGNVSSITDNGTGDYTVNFTTAMPDGNYSVTGAGRYADNSTAGAMRVVSICSVGTLANAMQTSSVRISTQFQNAGAEDLQVVCCTVFR
jgi:uncharacterized protein (AIM24 family)